MTIGAGVISAIATGCQSLLVDYKDELNKAYGELGDDPLSISFGVKLFPGPDGVDIDINMSFVTGKIKDKISRTVNENQANLFEDEDHGR